MKNRSTLAKFFFGERVPVDISKLNYKELTGYKGNKTCRVLTNMFLGIMYNALFGLGGYASIQHFGSGNVFNSIGSGSLMCGYGIGHITINAVHGIANKFTKEKTSKDMVDNGNPIPKKSGVGIAFLIITIVPLLIWLIGSIVVLCQCKKYKKEHGNYLTDKQKEATRLQEKAVDKNVVLETTKELMKSIVKGSGE